MFHLNPHNVDLEPMFWKPRRWTGTHDPTAMHVHDMVAQMQDLTQADINSKHLDPKTLLAQQPQNKAPSKSSHAPGPYNGIGKTIGR